MGLSFAPTVHDVDVVLCDYAQGFQEAPITFPPTYKKNDGRPPLDMSREDWVDVEYQTKMTTQWYKGARVQDRIPSVSL